MVGAVVGLVGAPVTVTVVVTVDGAGIGTEQCTVKPTAPDPVVVTGFGVHVAVCPDEAA